MCVFCDKVKFGSTAVLDCRTDQNNSRYSKIELLLLLMALLELILKLSSYENLTKVTKGLKRQKNVEWKFGVRRRGVIQ